ncbi:hypothetical protein EYV94_04700 [Puteibacter caeruleilacunae]|nr:hypothetical protein EYV94_04700 [Puteibacter caeruleilacunae]
MNTKIFLFAILIFLSNQTFSQSIKFKGKVVDFDTNELLVGARIVDMNGNKDVAISDLDGNIKFEGKKEIKNLYIRYAGCYRIKLINIPEGGKDIDFGNIKMVPNHHDDNIRIGGPSPELTDEQKKDDERLKREVLKSYRIKIQGKAPKPYFDRSELVFDFSKEG